jgi:inner membrane protein COX18
MAAGGPDVTLSMIFICTSDHLVPSLARDRVANLLVTDSISGEECLLMAMSGHVSRGLGLSASRLRPLVSYVQPASFQHESSSFTGRRLRQPGRGATGSRHFHIAPFVESSVQLSEHLITALHTATGTPWFITIPLVGLAVNAVFRLPFFVYSQKIAQRRSELFPLFLAWTAKLRRAVEREPIPSAKKEAEFMRRYTKVTKRIYKKWGLQQWKMHGSILAFPFWLCVIESIRRLSGGQPGALGTLVFRSRPRSGEPVSTAAASASTSPTAPTGAVSLSDILPTDGSSILSAQDIAASAIDPTLATGGCLWFPNLLEADPYHVLPFVLSGMLVLNVLPESTAGKLALFGVEDKSKNTRLAQSRLARSVQRTLLLLALVIGPVTLHLPAAIHLYWISSAGFSGLLQKGIKAYMPVPKPSLRPCTGSERLILRPVPPKTKAAAHR